MAKRLTSIFTEDMDYCFFTGSPYKEIHHIFNKWAKKYSEQYGYTIPVRYDLHPNGARWKDSPEQQAILRALCARDFYNYKNLDEYMKMHCQKHWEANTGTRQEFIQTFGRNYL